MHAAHQDDKHATPDMTLRGSLLVSTLKTMIVAYLISLAIWGLATFSLPLEVRIPVIAAAILASVFALVLHGLHEHDHPRFGYANLVTALRAGIVSLLAAIVLFSANFANPKSALITWAMIGAVLLVLAMDGVDGYLARRYRQQSALGARFDMEIDAFLILILSVAVFVLDKAGAWVILIGLMRYLFIAAQCVIAALRRPLFVSFRRKLICVVQVAVLCAVLVPGLGQPISAALCVLALATLVYSFAADVWWLMTQRGDAS